MMSFRPSLALLVLVGLLFLLPGEVDARDEASDVGKRASPKTWHATAYIRGRMGIRVIDYWSRGPNMRAHTLIGGHPVVTLVRGDRYVAFDLLEGKGIDIQRSDAARAEDRKRVRPFAFELEDVIRDGGEKIEEIGVGRAKAEIWQVTDGQGRRKIWVSSQEPRVPLRMETFDRASTESVDLDYSNWTFDLDFPDAFFETPQGLAVEVFEYDDYLSKSMEGAVRSALVLYPDLLHGSRPE